MANRISSLAFREFSKRKKQYILNISLIALVVVMLTTLNSLGIAYKEASRLPFEKIHNSIIVQKNGNVPENTSGAVTSCSLAPIRNDVIAQIKEIGGVDDVSYGLSLWVFDSDSFKRVLGVNWNDSLGAKIKASIVDGRYPQKIDEAIIDKTYADEYNLSIGKKAAVSGREFTVTGIGKNTGNDVVASDIFIGLRPAQDIAYGSVNLQNTARFEHDDINIIFVDAEQTEIGAVAAKLQHILNNNDLGNGKTPTGKTIGSYTIYTPASFEDQISSLFVLSDRLILFISAITIIGSVIIIIKSMSHTLMLRKKEFGIMKTVGFTSRDIRKEVAGEMFFQIIIGYVLGMIVSFVSIILLSRTRISISIPWELNPYPHFLASNPSLVNTVQTYHLPVRLQPMYAIISFLVVMVIGLLTTFFITNHINKLKAVEVLKG